MINFLPVAFDVRTVPRDHVPLVYSQEQRLAALLVYAKGLRAANEALRRGLTAAETRNQALSERVAEAKRRLDVLVARLPEPAE